MIFVIIFSAISKIVQIKSKEIVSRRQGCINKNIVFQLHALYITYLKVNLFSVYLFLSGRQKIIKSCRKVFYIYVYNSYHIPITFKWRR
jgi:hypothetical protein